MKRVIGTKMLTDFEVYLRMEERSENTIDKYLRDVKKLEDFTAQRELTKEMVIEFKKSLVETYEMTSTNSIIAAVNAFLKFAGWTDCCVKQFKLQRKSFCSEEEELTKAEYIRLLNAAKQRRNERLYLLLQTICGTGIRVSELQFITVEAVRRGVAEVSCKGKTRMVFIVRKLQRKLLDYIKKMGLTTGSIFVTKNGKIMNRCNVWREMKSLCEEAKVSRNKVFPHNLRHLFARTFYKIEKDIAKLADILGHISVDTTRIYIVSSGVEHKRKMENMRLII